MLILILNFNGGKNAKFTRYINNTKHNNLLYNNKYNIIFNNVHRQAKSQKRQAQK